MQYKKSLGQNILHGNGILKKITNGLIDINKNIIIEIGGGTGNLTQFLTDAKKLIIYEIDRNFADLLKEKFTGNNIEIKNEDFLNADLKQFKNNYLLIGNIPYFLTGQILRKIFTKENYPEIVVLTISKEQGEKLFGIPYSNFFSNWIKIWGKIEKICIIKANSFFPPPKVDSMAIKIKFFKKPLIENPEKFVKFLKILFRQPKKTILNNLKIFSFAKIFEMEKIKNLRPHQLSFEQILELYKMYITKQSQKNNPKINPL